ncbi:MAG: type II secretion system F family protein [Candidatus Micrarchaeia archaeon]
MVKYFYERISAFLPRSLVEGVGVLMVQGGFDSIRPPVFLGFVLFFSSCVAVIAWFVSQFFFVEPLYFLGCAVGGFLVSVALFYVFLVNAADSRAARFEAVLPDAFSLISANIRAGMTLENAIWGSARPEFGPFKDEIKKVSAETFGGKPVTVALQGMAARVRSDVVARAVGLIGEGIKLGGEMSRLLDEVAEDVRNIALLRKEILTSTLTYTIFVLFASLAAAPLLFAVTTYYSELNEKILSQRVSGGAVSQQYLFAAGVTGMPGTYFGGLRQGGISSSDVFLFSVAALAVTNFFSALLFALIRTGKALQGVKLAPVFVLASIAVFVFVHWVLRLLFKSVVA